MSQTGSQRAKKVSNKKCLKQDVIKQKILKHEVSETHTCISYTGSYEVKNVPTSIR